MGTKLCKASKINVQNIQIIPTNRAESRMNKGLLARIVIPVVVGSSPISHPKIEKGSFLGALFLWFYVLGLSYSLCPCCMQFFIAVHQAMVPL